MFIDKGVDYYQKITNSIDVSKSIYLIHKNTLKNSRRISIQTDVDAIILLATQMGQVVLGNSVQNKQIFQSNQSIGESLTKDGDTFYGCNLAKGSKENFCSTIGNITQADIAD